MSTRLNEGDHISVEDEPFLLVVEDPEPVQCPPDCTTPHESECFDEPYVWVRQESRFWVPVRKIRMVFDQKTHIGVPFER